MCYSFHTTYCLVHETSRNLKLNNQWDSLCCKMRVFMYLVEDIQTVGAGAAGSLSNDWTPGPERSHGLSPFFFSFLFSKKGTKVGISLSLYLSICHSVHVEVRAQLVLHGCSFYHVVPRDLSQVVRLSSSIFTAETSHHPGWH